MMTHFHRSSLLSLGLALALAGCQAATGTPSAPAPGAGSVPTAITGGVSPIKTIPVGKTPHGMGAAGDFVYNSNIGEGTLSVIDAKSDSVVKTIPFDGGTPGYVKAFHDGKHVLVTDTKLGKLLVLDPAQDHKVLQAVALGKNPDKIVVHSDDKRVLVTLTGESKALLLTFDADRTKAPAVQTFGIGSVAGSGESKHRSGALLGDWAVAPNSGENNTSLINLKDGSIKNVTDGNNPGPVVLAGENGAASVAAVGNAASNTISLFDLPSGAKTTLADVGLSPTDGAYCAEAKRVFISMAGSNDVAVIDPFAKKLVGRVAVGNRPVHVYLVPALPAAKAYRLAHGDEAHEAAAAHEVWVGNDSGDSVSVIDSETLKVKATIPVGKGHHKMAFAGSKAYISNITDNTVSVIDRAQIK